MYFYFILPVDTRNNPEDIFSFCSPFYKIKWEVKDIVQFALRVKTSFKKSASSIYKHIHPFYLQSTLLNEHFLVRPHLLFVTLEINPREQVQLIFLYITYQF